MEICEFVEFFLIKWICRVDIDYTSPIIYFLITFLYTSHQFWLFSQGHTSYNLPYTHYTPPPSNIPKISSYDKGVELVFCGSRLWVFFSFPHCVLPSSGVLCVSLLVVLCGKEKVCGVPKFGSELVRFQTSRLLKIQKWGSVCKYIRSSTSVLDGYRTKLPYLRNSRKKGCARFINDIFVFSLVWGDVQWVEGCCKKYGLFSHLHRTETRH